MVQRKPAMKPHLLKSDIQLVNHRPSSPQTHDKLKKIMKKTRQVKRSDDLPSSRNKTTHPEDGAVSTPQKQSPNYMKSTSSFEARKERSPAVSGQKGSRASSLKIVRPSSVIVCENLDAQKATCSSTLRDSKFPKYLQLTPGGTESEGTSAIHVCPYTYCSLNGHHRVPVQPLRCFLSARRRVMKTQKSFKLGCLSPRHTKPVEKKKDQSVLIFEAPEEVDMEPSATPVSLVKQESRDFFIEIYSKNQEGNGFYSQHQDLYDEESVSSGAWSEENGDLESESSYHQREDQGFLNDDAFEVSSITTEADMNEKMGEDKTESITEELETTNGWKNSGLEEKKDELQGLNLPLGDGDREEKSQESENNDFADKSQDETSKHHTKIIYNIIQFNISVFVNGEKTEHSETGEGLTVQVPATAGEEQVRSNEDGDVSEIPFHSRDSRFNANEAEIKCDGCLEDDKDSKSSGLQVTKQGDHDVEKINEEPATTSNEKQTDFTGEIAYQTNAINSFASNKRASNELSIDLIKPTQGKKLNQELEDSKEYNPRGPNFLPEVVEPDAETVDLRHQMMDERRNAEEWMVDFALRQAVTTLPTDRRRKVALLVEAFEKVMPIPRYENRNRRTSKAFTNARPMQACS